MNSQICDFCSKQFATKQSCNIHKLKCKMKDQFYKIEDKEKIIAKLEEENKKLKEESEFLKNIIKIQNKSTNKISKQVNNTNTQINIFNTDPIANILLNTAIKQNADTIIDKAEDRYQYWKSQINDAREEDIEPDSSDLENKEHTKKLKNIAQKAKNNISVDSTNATNFIVLKGMENKSVVNTIE